jgi:hypothetical protein
MHNFALSKCASGTVLFLKTLIHFKQRGFDEFALNNEVLGLSKKKVTGLKAW